MRKADDLSDDESLPREERREQLGVLAGAWHLARDRRQPATRSSWPCAMPPPAFQIPLQPPRRTGRRHHHGSEASRRPQPDTYATFADLYRYCYLVASVVGLVCIRIFGYSDPRAEKLAEETGIAFQLTNILRDVAEDAERNRIYLPLEDLASPRRLRQPIAHPPRGKHHRQRARIAQKHR
jgi:phytoene synthase